MLFTAFSNKVKEEFKRREDIAMRNVDGDEIANYYKRTPWMKIIPNIEIKHNGKQIDNSKYILGNYKDSPSSRYTFEGDSHKHRPDPVLEKIDVTTKGERGSLREIKFSFKCWTIDQFSIYEKLYMTPGSSVVIQYGWSTTDAKIYDYSNVKELWKGLTKKDDVAKRCRDIRVNNPDYDIYILIITNFDWSINEEGGFDCNATAITIGESSIKQHMNKLRDKGGNNVKSFFDKQSKNNYLEYIKNNVWHQKINEKTYTTFASFYTSIINKFIAHSFFIFHNKPFPIFTNFKKIPKKFMSTDPDFMIISGYPENDNINIEKFDVNNVSYSFIRCILFNIEKLSKIFKESGSIEDFYVKFLNKVNSSTMNYWNLSLKNLIDDYGFYFITDDDIVHTNRMNELYNNSYEFPIYSSKNINLDFSVSSNISEAVKNSVMASITNKNSTNDLWGSFEDPYVTAVTYEETKKLKRASNLSKEMQKKINDAKISSEELNEVEVEKNRNRRVEVDRIPEGGGVVVPKI